MTRNEFLIICNEYGIAPSLALENDGVREYASAGNITELRKVFETEF